MRRARGLAPAALLLALAACERERPGEAAVAGVVAARPGLAAGVPILLGHVAALTGSDAAPGDSADKGIRLAVEEQNARGGVRGREVVVRTADEQGRLEEVALAATRLVVEDQVSVLLGEAVGRRALAMAPVADKHLVPLVTLSPSPKVTRDGEMTRPFVFRVASAGPLQGAIMAAFARQGPKLQKVAVLRDVGSEDSVGQADAFLSRFKELGGEIVDDQSYRAGDADFKAQLVAIRRRKPDGLYVPGQAAEAALIARQARELGLALTVMGGDGWGAARLHELARGALEGGYFTTSFSPDDPSPRVVEFVRRYRARHGAAPDAAAALGYDAARVALEAMARAPDLSRTAIRDAIAATNGLQGVTGDLTLGPDHGAVRPVALLRVQGEQATFVETRRP
jgi:branched-chain amino acid transport system substrate-binding protein